MPVLILVIIAIPSFKLLYFVDVVPKTDMTLKAIGHQWYWSYEYPDNGNFTFDANLVDQADLKPGQHYLRETDNQIVLPVETNIRLQTTATDVIHSWTIQQWGIKLDAEPGHLNQVWFRINEPGIYYGQCSEICRRQPRLHADRREGGAQGGVRCLGEGRPEEVRPRRRAAGRGRPGGTGRPLTGTSGRGTGTPWQPTAKRTPTTTRTATRPA